MSWLKELLLLALTVVFSFFSIFFVSSQSPGTQRCSPSDSSSPAQSHKHGNGSLCDSKASPINTLAINVNTENKSHKAAQQQASFAAECKDHAEKEGEGTEGETGHLLNLESWQHDLRHTSTEAPVLYALDFLQDILNENNVKWMAKARRIWIMWKKQPQDVRKKYVERAKENRSRVRSEQTLSAKRHQSHTGRGTSSSSGHNSTRLGKGIFTSSDGVKLHRSARPKQTASTPPLDRTRKEPLMVVGASTMLCAKEVPYGNDHNSRIGPSLSPWLIAKQCNP